MVLNHKDYRLQPHLRQTSSVKHTCIQASANFFRKNCARGPDFLAITGKTCGGIGVIYFLLTERIINSFSQLMHSLISALIPLRAARACPFPEQLTRPLQNGHNRLAVWQHKSGQRVKVFRPKHPFIGSEHS